MKNDATENRALAVCLEVVAAEFGRACYEAAVAGRPIAEVSERARLVHCRLMAEISANLETYADAIEAGGVEREADEIAAKVAAWARVLRTDRDAEQTYREASRVLVP